MNVSTDVWCVAAAQVHRGGAVSVINARGCLYASSKAASFSADCTVTGQLVDQCSSWRSEPHSAHNEMSDTELGTVGSFPPHARSAPFIIGG
jgi:hypothetical protein